MLEVSLHGFNYARLAISNPTHVRAEDLTEKYNYIQLIAYEQMDLEAFQCVKKNSSVINLTKDIDEIFGDFQSTVKNTINKTKRDDNLTFISDDPNWQVAYDLHKEFDLARGWMPAPLGEIQNSIIYSAYFKEHLISGITCFGHDKVIRVGKLYSKRLTNDIDQLSNQLISWVTRRLIFEICKYGQDHGYELLDLGGVDFDDPVKVGISRFKQSFGGDIVDAYNYRYCTQQFEALRKQLKQDKIDIS